MEENEDIIKDLDKFINDLNDDLEQLYDSLDPSIADIKNYLFTNEKKQPRKKR